MAKLTNPVRFDPTRTTVLRRQFYRELRRRMLSLSNAIWKLIVIDDAFGRDRANLWIIHRNANQYSFLTDPDKVEAFRQWLKEQVAMGLLQVVGGVPERPWTADFVESAYKKGLMRAYTDAHKREMVERPEFFAGTKEQFVRDIFAQPEMMSKIVLLGTRSFESMRNLTAQMSADMSRILADGLANGFGAVKIARAMRDQIAGMSQARALLITRTEIIHAHAEGQLDALQTLGVKEVQAEVEWTTAGDMLVCPRCQKLSGKRFTIAEARGMIPLHPNCRCSWTPV